MFGEKEIKGETIIKVDHSRIIIPKFTGITPYEKIALTYDLKRTKILIKRMIDYARYVEFYEQLITKKYKNNLMSYQEYLEWIAFLYGHICICRAITDEFNRITIPKEPLEYLNISDSLFAVGKGNSLELYPSKEHYLKEKIVK